MKSPAQRHFERVSAALAAASAAPGESLAGASRYELMLAKLATDRRRLKEIQAVSRKIEVKREVLPEYADYVAGALEGGRGAQDDVLMTVMVWRIDAGDYAGALPIAEYALTHKLTMPDQYDRSTATVIAEEFAEAALNGFKADQEFPAVRLAQVIALTESHDMPDQVQAKLLKAYAFALIRGAGDVIGPDRPVYEAALEQMRRAVTLDPRVGVKNDIKAIEKALSQAAGDNAGGE